MTMLRFFIAKNRVASLGLFIGGNNGASILLTSEKYQFANNAVSSGSSISTGNIYSFAGSNGNIAVNAGGYPSNANTTASRKYVFSGDTSTTTQSLSVASRGATCSTTMNVAIFAGGTETALVATTRKLSFSTDSYSNGGNLGTARGAGVVGNQQDFGLHACGQGPLSSFLATSDKYNYSSDTSSGGSTFASNRYICASIEDGSFVHAVSGNTGLFEISTSEKYKFSDGVISSSTSLTEHRQVAVCASNREVGVISAGTSVGVNRSTSYIFTFSSQTYSSGSSLSGPRQGAAGASSTPSHL